MFLKFLLTAVFVYAAWQAFKVLERRNRGPGKVDDDTASLEVEELTECKVCGAYVTASGATGCDRDDCPHRPSP
jgi:hypothetical protein